jgi:hypothetical protein
MLMSGIGFVHDRVRIPPIPMLVLQLLDPISQGLTILIRQAGDQRYQPMPEIP